MAGVEYSKQPGATRECKRKVRQPKRPKLGNVDFEEDDNEEHGHEDDDYYSG